MWRPFYYISKGIYSLLAPFYPTKVINKGNISKKGKLIYACNHLSNLDIPLTIIHTGGLRRYIAKKELKNIFFIGSVFSCFGCIFIDRESPKMSEIREILEWLNKDEQIMIFPEGTRNKTENEQQCLPFKSGLALFAAKSGAPVIPVLMHHRSHFFRKNYIYFGKPIDIIEDKGRFPIATDLEKYTTRYELEFERERVIFNDIVENKRWKKKNKLAENEKCQALIDWELEHNYKPYIINEEKTND